MNRDEAKQLMGKLSPKELEAIALFIETGEVQGDWMFNGDDSVYEDDVAGTLNGLAGEVRRMIPGEKEEESG